MIISGDVLQMKCGSFFFTYEQTTPYLNIPNPLNYHFLSKKTTPLKTFLFQDTHYS